MNAFDVLTKDHESIASILEQLSVTTPPAVSARDDLLERLRREMDLHVRIEERIFYAALKHYEEARALVLEAIEEHDTLQRLLNELDAAPRDDEQWSSKLSILKLNIEHHARAEEGEVFSRAREVLSAAQIEDLGVRLQEEKETSAVAGGR